MSKKQIYDKIMKDFKEGKLYTKGGKKVYQAAIADQIARKEAEDDQLNTPQKLLNAFGIPTEADLIRNANNGNSEAENA